MKREIYQNENQKLVFDEKIQMKTFKINNVIDRSGQLFGLRFFTLRKKSHSVGL